MKYIIKSIRLVALFVGIFITVNSYGQTVLSSIELVASPVHPHEIVIELTPPCKIKGFTYLPRQDEEVNGTIKDYEFFVSNDGKEFGQPLKKGAFERGKEIKTVTFDAKTCQFIKLKALSEINDQPWTSAAEIGIIQEVESVAAKPSLKVVKVDSEQIFGEDHQGANAVDGNPATFWHTQWRAVTAARLTVLVDNSVAQDSVKAVWGFACLVQARGHTVLFDTGPDPAVLKDNLAALNVDPARIEAVVISHFHPDHTFGAPGLVVRKGLPAYTPGSFDRYEKEAAALDAAGLVRVPVATGTNLFDGFRVSEPLHFGGTSPSTGEYWEQYLTVDTPDGLVVIVGCSHPGILAMLEQVKQQTGRPIDLVIGGFHLLDQPDAEVRRIATAMKAMGVAHVSAAHCTGEAAASVFRDVFGDHYVNAGVGAVIGVAAPPSDAHYKGVRDD